MPDSTDPARTRQRRLVPLSLVWPAVAVVGMILFHGPISAFLYGLGKAEVTWTKDGPKIALIAASIAAAEAGRQAGGEATRVDASKAVAAAERIVEQTRGGNLRGAKVLWVDDNPDNNRYERGALEALGITFDLARNTKQAETKLDRAQYAAVISDFKRSDDPTAGYTLLEVVKRLPKPPPYIIYSGSASAEFVAEAKRRGAFGETNQPQELFDLVIDAIKRGPAQ